MTMTAVAAGHWRPGRWPSIRRPATVYMMWLIVTTAVTGRADAQAIGLSPDRDLPAWLVRWSVLAPRADLPRHAPTSSTAVPITLLPRTTIGMFWTAANPAGLAGAVDSARADFMTAVARTRGDFRRPLDPGGASLRQVSATAWRPVDSRVTMLGRVAIDQERFDPGAQADETEPYPTSPFITTDSSTSPTRRTRARLEGVVGWTFDDWALGADLGYDTRDNQTIEAGFVRRARQTMPGLAVGVVRRIGSVRGGLTARYRNRIETIRLIERAAEGQVIQLEGYRDVTPISVMQSYYRRVDEDVPSASVGMDGRFGTKARWVLFAELARLRERRTRQEQNDPAVDRWNAASWTVGGAYQRTSGAAGRWLLTLDGRYTALNGDGDLALDSAGTVFVATERAFEGRAELRRLPTANGWTGLVALTSRIERRVRNDSIVRIGSDIRTIGLGLSAEVGRSVARDVSLVGTAALVTQAATSSIPDPAARRAVYQQLLAPELGYYARDVVPWSVGIALQWQVSPGTALWISARTEALSPRGTIDPGGSSPDGSRTATSVVLGVVSR